MTPHFFTVISHLLTLALVCSAALIWEEVRVDGVANHQPYMAWHAASYTCNIH